MNPRANVTYRRGSQGIIHIGPGNDSFFVPETLEVSAVFIRSVGHHGRRCVASVKQLVLGTKCASAQLDRSLGVLKE